MYLVFFRYLVITDVFIYLFTFVSTTITLAKNDEYIITHVSYYVELQYLKANIKGSDLTTHISNSNSPYMSGYLGFFTQIQPWKTRTCYNCVQ